ncbi:MAG: 30S ribosomal protein S21 [Parcubacteria group bacterium GW2011_GWD2_43_10]|uniref:Small ribosomal subunit protein bS21 n=4 Tax=Candidatus Vebleniibacteriota TaxID=1817921 RepID=A0A1G2QAJ5_9BACT|nr:MAG: 30S ribosomal protein S21 [Parcubacteria group bacterium GW2011_GWA2_42_80]KKS79564.1 MAG: 30S ribosomal protein S21 [Parcubacteria group bacterium GW2011_GWD1_42_9]KKS81952.1 MAG: 30S ribosomal protein S21 [Parcubacteria group bacterium GW2011_GWD2_43_10]KKS92673.1 MAG: 30S ribosomal protein S21 [Parcubacteria group bacterium GW2011_GWE2_43_12]KKT13905.1 MAG: 30S ribosomal protein S21 [Parcubacteria group bacterium GW2011_GWA1_43_27]KKT16043.1 MAG: 30S ribosomal protein S21 [Parcubact
MIEVKRRDGESVEGLMRRFSKRVQQSGVILRTKKRRFFATDKTKREQRSDALRRVAIRVRREYLRKTGQLSEEDLRSRNPRIKAMIKRTIKK